MKQSDGFKYILRFHQNSEILPSHTSLNSFISLRKRCTEEKSNAKISLLSFTNIDNGQRYIFVKTNIKLHLL